MNSLLLENNLGDVYIIADQVKSSTGTDLKIDIAFSLAAALKFLEKKTYDFIMLDYNLPEISGADLILTVIKRAFMTPVIVLDDYYSETNRKTALSMGAADYIIKNSLDCVSLESVIKNSMDRIRVERLFLNNIPVPVIISRPEDNEVLWTNKEFENIIGYSLDEARSRKMDESLSFYSEDDKLAFAQCIQAEEHPGRIVAFRNMRGEKFTAIVSVMKNQEKVLPFIITVINNTEGTLSGMNNLYNVTASGRLENKTVEIIAKLSERIQILEQEKADNANLLAVIFHDLKTPFSALLGYSQFLAEELEDMSPKEIRDFAVEIHRSVKNVSKLVEEMLQWTLVHTEKTTFNPEAFDLNDIILEAIELIKPAAKIKNITLLTGLQENLKVLADKNMIAAVVRNLLSNAVKYTMGNNEGVIKVCTEKRDSIVYVEISDSGIGIKQDTLQGIFDVKTRLVKHGQIKEKGTGIGLVLCREYIKKNNGTISAQSTESSGSTFTFTLPFFN